MCGISVQLKCRRVLISDAIKAFCGPELASASSSSSSSSSTSSPVDWLQRRGPDVSKTTAREHGNLQLSGSVLHMRGSTHGAIAQPLEADGDALLWNGELFRCERVHVAPGVNDSRIVFEAVRAAAAQSVDAVVELLSSFQGPWAIVFYHAVSRRLLFARDPLGRRSLLLGLSDDSFQLASVSQGDATWTELAPRGLYALDLSAADDVVPLRLLPWPDSASDVDPNWSAFPRRVPLLERAPPSQQTTARFPAPRDEESDNCGADDGVCGAFLDALLDATRLRVCDVPLPPPRPTGAPQCRPARVAVLFSGGVDSAVLAALCHAELPAAEPIDLINVSFAGDRAPDRASALATLHELRCVAPTQREWRLVLVDVTEADVAQWQAHILRLCEPHVSVMDMTIGIALWFGARGLGSVDGVPFESQARVLLTGHGADEQLGGYKRLRTRFNQGGWAAAQEEIELDQRRLWSRNLGRDDRVVSDCGRELRCVFLDEGVLRMLATAPLSAICNLPAGDDGVGDKHLIRRAARRLGLTASSRMVKRAIQFGTRIAAVYKSAARRTGVEGASKGQSSYSSVAFTDVD
jgi:asparagine synthetase B (glutamine-hydrolysing)